MQDFDFKYHIFISHASEDKDDFVRPLAKKLIKIGYRVWYDEFSLIIGDNLSRSIDKGLKDSRFGLIVISPDFIKKHWTQVELAGLIQKELKYGKVIIPIWHNVSYQQVFDFSPTLADKLATESKKGLDHVVNEIVKALKESGADNVQKISIKPPTPTGDISSKTGIDYNKLSELLAAHNWKEADKETYKLIIKAVPKKSRDRFTNDQLLNFPCQDLLSIDQLWVKHSKGRFGFSVQKEIYLRSGGISDGNYYKTHWKKFCQRVGWRIGFSGEWLEYNYLTFHDTAPRGHLPTFTIVVPMYYWWYWDLWNVLWGVEGVEYWFVESWWFEVYDGADEGWLRRLGFRRRDIPLYGGLDWRGSLLSHRDL
ncbi:Ycf53-like protein [Dolichospermum sp. UHCC 0315A]|uniref:GUN4 domain-containing protein n=1 Tax=Dolichospermum sp. UHCC 0315A TaxID=1914871 RepID=UPI0011E6EC03|nr:GUN4 domain-containing protein [Dolichospermum sp. UHCC 0315A]QEI40313.1 Ycf53-like protein [Dolichospermum sp. UHCC 0315A]